MTTHTDTRPSSHTAELTAFLDALAVTPADAPTACPGWTAHELVAHLVAGAQEIAALVDARLAGRPARPTRSFEEREAPWRARHDDELRGALYDGARLLTALDAMHERDPELTVAFTGWEMTATQLMTHVRSELALHRWDLVGDDAVGDALLAQPVLLAHARLALARMPTLAEARRAPVEGDDLLARWGRR